MNNIASSPIQWIRAGAVLVGAVALLALVARCTPSDAPPTDGGGTGVPVPQNNPPVASAGEDQVVNAGANVTLDASGSSDPDGNAISFSWRQTLGTPVALNSTAAAVVAFTAPANGTALVFELTVSDGQNSSIDTVGVSVLPVDSSAQVVQYRPTVTIRDDPAVQGNLPPSHELQRPPEAPAAQKVGGAHALLGVTQFAPLADVPLAPGATHDVHLQVAGPSLLTGSARWIGTRDPLDLSVSLDGADLANGIGQPTGPDRGLSTLSARTTAGGLATLSVTNTSSVTVSVRVVFGALSLDLE